MKKSIILSMAALMSLTSAAAFAADKTLGFDDLYNNPKAITQAMQESNAQLPVSEAVSTANNLKKLNEYTKLSLINALKRNKRFSVLSSFFAKNIANTFLYNENIFLFGEKNAKGFKVKYINTNKDLIEIISALDSTVFILQKNINRIDYFDTLPTCIKTKKEIVCGKRKSCTELADFMPPATAAGMGLITEAISYLTTHHMAPGEAVAEAAIGGELVGTVIEHYLNDFVCNDIEDCEETDVCVEWLR